MFEREFGEGAFDDEPDGIDRLCQDALGMFEEGDLSAAKERAMEAVSMDDEHPFPMFVLGMIAEFEGDLPAARDLSELALRTASTNADAIQLRAQVHVREHEFEQAEELLRFGVLHNPDDAVLHEGLARILLATGRTRSALVAATTALRLDSTNSGALAVRSAAMDAMDDRDGLLASLRQTVQLHPHDIHSLLELAALEAERGNLGRARALIGRAQRISPHDSEVQEARLLIEQVHSWPLLRPLPRLLGWLREFPGGLSGFMLGLLVAALPLQALTQAQPAYSLPAWLVLGAWASVAAYAWIGPAVLTRRITRVAAASGTEAFYASVATADSGAVEVDAVLDLVHTQLAAHERAAAVETLRVAATVCEPAVADALLTVARKLDRRSRRACEWLVRVPGLPRVLVALAAALIVAAPVVDAASTLGAAYGGALVALALAVVLARLDRALTGVLQGVSIEAPPAATDNRVAQDVA